MKFMTIVKSSENIGPAPQAMSDAVAQAMAEGFKSGRIVEAGGLMRSEAGAKVRLSGGKITITDGPFTEAKEVIGGLAILQANSKEEAIELVKEFLQVAGDGECELRQLYDAGSTPGA